MADYISREAAVSLIFDKVWTKTDEDGYIWVLRRDVIHALDDIPAADVRPVVLGTWIKRRFSEDVYGVECSVCHTTWDYDTCFCPYCGADMREQGAEGGA
jgi:hypothetical protein